MLSQLELDALIIKIELYRPKFEKSRGSGCIPKGIELYSNHRGGTLIWIGELSRIGLGYIALDHLYYFTPDSNSDSLALNLADQGYPQYPPLTLNEALTIGDPKDPENDTGQFFFKVARL